jgi:hypothetical protein
VLVLEPLVEGIDVGPEGTVGACRFSILNGIPMSTERRGRTEAIMVFSLVIDPSTTRL